MPAITESANNLAAEFSTLSSPYRILIIRYLLQNREATWSEIKQFLEAHFGSLNPNTLHFHLKELIKADLIGRSDRDEKSTYVLKSVPQEISDAIKKKIRGV